MNKQKAHSLLIDYIYDEISAENKKKLVNELKNNAGLRRELDELRQTQGLLQQMPEVEAPEKKLHIMEPNERNFRQWLSDVKLLLPHTGRGKATLATAACLALFLVIASAVSLEVSSNKAGFSMSLGYGNSVNYENKVEEPVLNKEDVKKLIAQQQKEEVEQQAISANRLTEQDAEQFFTQKQAEALLAKIQQQNKALLTAFAHKMNKQDQQQLQKIVKFFQAQRMYDLKRISQSLNQTQLANAYRWQQTNLVLGEIIETASVETADGRR